MLIKKQKSLLSPIESDLCANVRFFALVNVSLRCWSTILANECVFSRNEQQKVFFPFLQHYHNSERLLRETKRRKFSGAA